MNKPSNQIKFKAIEEGTLYKRFSIRTWKYFTPDEYKKRLNFLGMD